MEKKLIVYYLCIGMVCQVVEQMVVQSGWQFVEVIDEYLCVGFLGDVCCVIEMVFYVCVKYCYEGLLFGEVEYVVVIVFIWMGYLVLFMWDFLVD